MTKKASWNSADWSISSSSKTCSECDRSFHGGDTFYSALMSADEIEQDERCSETGEETEPDETERAYLRLDLCPSCWDEAHPDPFSFWKQQAPEPDEKDAEPDRSTLAGIWRGLLEARTSPDQPSDKSTDSDPDPERTEELLYLLTLMLMRKGFLSLEEDRREGDRRTVYVRIRGTDEERYEIPEPDLTEEGIERVRNDLAHLLDSDEAPSDMTDDD